MITRPLPIIGISVAGLALAVVLAFQAAGSVQSRDNPATANLLAPWNGSALEQLALQKFHASATDQSQIVPSATQAVGTAVRAFELDPLAPKALALIALAETNPTQKRRILDAATALNRRDLLLQGLLLEQQVVAEDYPGTIATLDRILRVNPSQKANFFPVLIDALTQDQALPALTQVLEKGSVWQEDFLKAASIKREALPNLAKLRLAKGIVDPEIDSRLVAGLVAQGDVLQAAKIYQLATGKNGATTMPLAIDWASDFAPFDWEFTDEAGFRAQVARDPKNLEVFIRGGSGGTFAKRLLANPGGPFTVKWTHTLLPDGQVKDVRIALRCFGSDEVIGEQAFRSGMNAFNVPAASCDFLELALIGRSWTGRATTRGEIGPLMMSKNITAQ